MSRFAKKAQLRGLVITRKEGDQILINHGELKVEVVEIKGRWVRLAFEAAKEIVIQRAETLQDNTLAKVQD